MSQLIKDMLERVLPDKDDDERGRILWNCTAFPFNGIKAEDIGLYEEQIKQAIEARPEDPVRWAEEQSDKDMAVTYSKKMINGNATQNACTGALVKLSIILNEEKTPIGTDIFVAHCIEYDIMAWADTEEELRDRIHDMVASHIHSDVTIRDREPFSERSNVGRELLQYWWRADPLESQKMTIENLRPCYNEEQKEKLKGPWEIEAVWRKVNLEAVFAE